MPVTIAAGDDANWKLNEGSGSSTVDSSGNGHAGTLFNTPTWTEGIFGNALSFDEISEYLRVDDFAYGPDFSMTFWLNWQDDSGAGFQYIFSHGVVGSQNSLNVYLQESGTTVYTYFRDSNDADVQVSFNATLEDTGWHLYTLTVSSANGVRVYLDGTQVASNGSLGGGAYNPSTNIYIAARQDLDTNRFYGGILDDINIFDRELSAMEVASLAQGHGLLAHWKLDEAGGGIAIDSVGLNNGTITNATGVPGKLCDALDFDGSGDYVTITGLLGQPANITLAAWVNVDASSDGDEVVSLGDYVAIRVDENGPGTNGFYYRGSSNWNITGSGIDYAGTGWHHITYVLNDTNNVQVLYVDGISVASSTYTQSITWAGLGSNTFIGRHGNGAASDFVGVIDDVRVYRRALTQAEVQSLAATYRVISLGSATGNPSLGTAINNAEEIVGYDEDTSSSDAIGWFAQYCLFVETGQLTGGSTSEAHGLNDSSVACGWSENSSGRRRAVTWTSGGGLVDLGVVGSRTDSEALAINSSNQVVGTSLNFGVPPSGHMAFAYLPSPAYTLSAGMNALGTLGGTRSTARDMNDSGIIVGGATQVDGNARPYMWENGSFTNLGTLGGESPSILHRAEAINGNDEIVGLSYTAGGEQHAFLYLPSAAYGQSMGMNDLGTLGSGDTSVALDINDDGKVVGTSNLTPSGTTYHAFLWEDGTMTDLNDLIDANSGWVLYRATSINDDGEISGWGAQGADVRAFVLIQTCATGADTQVQFALEGEESRLETNNDGFGELFLADSDGAELGTIVVESSNVGDSFEAEVRNMLTTGEPAAAGLIGRRFVITTSASSGTFAMTLYVPVVALAWNGSGRSADDLVLVPVSMSPFVTTSPQLYAVDYVGMGQPSGIVGQTGYVQYKDGSIDLWLVADRPGVFAVQENHLVISDNTAPPSSGNAPRSRLCGVGMILASALCFLGLARARRTFPFGSTRQME